MRTLHRPMFNMGGPIKEGVMHGIREPYKGGQLVRPGPGRPGYAGLDPRKNVAKRVGAWGASKIPGFTKGWAKNLWNKYKFPPRMQATTPSGPGITTATKARDMWHRAGQYFGKHPYLSTLGPAYLSQTQPVQSVAKGVAGAIPEITQFGTEVLTPKKWEKYLPPDDWWKWKSDVEWKPGDVRGETPPPGDDLKTVVPKRDTGSDYGQFDRAQKRIAEGKATELAKQQKDDRVNKLLEIMGHKKSKKDAVYNALIDASQIVGAAPGGKGLDISKDIIQPIIGATSKRFDKPKEIEEAVRLMQTKAEIEKEMNPLDDAVKQWQIEGYKKQLAGATFKEAVLAASKDGVLTGDALAAKARQYLPGDFKLMQIKVPKKTDTLEFIVDTVKESHTNPDKDPFPPGQYVLKERVVSIDHIGNVTPLDV